MDDTTSENAEMEDEQHEDVATAPVEDELTAAVRERDEANEKWMRLQADFQNHRRHAQANIDAAAQRARAEVLGEAVTILDYLDMALAMEVTTDEARNLKVGVEMTRSELQSFFDRMNVKPIDATGTFDPERHQAVSTVETDEVEPGTIVEVVRSGWTLGDAILRYAQVRVAAAPDTDSAEAVEDGAAEEA
jgi:molecular chaperone GrpE